MAILKILVFVAILSTTKGCSEGDIRLQSPAGAVQLCDSQGEWRSICHNDNWGQAEANIACYQLGYSNEGAVAGSECLSNGPYVSIECTGTDTKLSECSRTNYGCNDRCDGRRSSKRWTSVVSCAPAICTNGEIRLVNGSTNREGRVEVCMDGRWGTVCNSNPPLAGAVCSQLGFPALGAIAESRFGPGFVSIRNCKVQTGGNLSCSLITDGSCDHSMDLGVVCRTCEQLYSELPNQCSGTDPPTTCPTCEEPVTAESCPTTTSSPVTTECVCPTCEDSTPCPTTTCPTVVNPPTEPCNHSNCTCPLNTTKPACDCPTTTPSPVTTECDCPKLEDPTPCPEITCPTYSTTESCDCPTNTTPPMTTKPYDCPSCEDPTPCPAITCPTCPTISEAPCPTITVNQHGIIQPSQTCPICPSSSNTVSLATVTSDQNRTDSEQNTGGQTSGRVEGCNSVGTPLLGGVVGVLVIVVIILAVGWCFTCVILVRRSSQTDKQKHFRQMNNKDDSTLERQLDNPVYDSNMETHNYSSSGPTYELVDTSAGAGLTYSTLEQCEESSQKPAEHEQHYYHVLESGESEGVTGGGCDYEVPVSGQTNSRVKLCEEEYSTLQH